MKKFSWTFSIILINFVILVSIELMGGPSVYNLLKFGGQFGPLVANGEWYRLFTAMFVHAGWIHLLFNMYALYYLGTFVERIYGPSKMLTIYFASGFVGNLLSQVFYYSVPSVGASGAIFGLVGLMLGGAYFRDDFSPHVRRQLIFWLMPMVIFNIVYGFIPGTDINNAAHLGGFLTGLVFGYFVHVKRTWKESLPWRVVSVMVLSVVFLSFIGLAFNNAMLTLQPTLNFANSYSRVLYELDSGMTPSKTDVELLEPVDKNGEKLKADLESYLRSGTPTLLELNREYSKWIESVKEKYKGLIKSEGGQ